jgi:hypothetical protein
VVRLEDGRITIDVAPLRPGERFRVTTGDGEVEVRGTSFDVAARDGCLLSVRVAHGRVVVRRHGQEVALLGAGESWAAPGPAPVAEPAPTVEPTPVRRRVRLPAHEAVPTPAPRESPPLAAEPPRAQGPSPAEASFTAGWDALRAGDYAAAAAAFARTIAAAPEGPLLEDGSYWRLVALARAGAGAAARDEMGRFTARFPRSPRAAEVSAMLGWALIDAGRWDEAEGRFRAALTSGSLPNAVRDSASAGLTAVARHRAAAP